MRAAAETLVAISKQVYFGPWMIAYPYAAAGDKEKALEWLEKGVDERDMLTVGGLKSEPRYTIMRGHPRYQALLRKMNLEP